LVSFAWLVFSPLIGTTAAPAPAAHANETPTPAAINDAVPVTVASIRPSGAVSPSDAASALPPPPPIAPPTLTSSEPDTNTVDESNFAALNSSPAWEPPALELANFQEEPTPFWMPSDLPDPSRDVALDKAQSFSLFGTPPEATPSPKKAVTKTSPKSRRTGGDGRRSSSGNPLQRAERTVRGLLNRVF
jgi:hypothetical protein